MTSDAFGFVSPLMKLIIVVVALSSAALDTTFRPPQTRFEIWMAL